MTHCVFTDTEITRAFKLFYWKLVVAVSCIFAVLAAGEVFIS